MDRRPRHPRPAQRTGLTLIELMVVIMIIGMLTLATVPLMNPQAQPKRIREAARMVNSALSATRSKAIGDGRSAGVVFERNKTLTSVCNKISFVQAPPPYGGDDSSSRIVNNAGTLSLTGVTNSLIQVGDTIQIAYVGQRYRIDSVSPLKLSGTISAVQPKIPPEGAPFQIYRQPLVNSKDSVIPGETPILLPSGVAVDLASSGLGAAGTTTGTNPLVIMFDSSGAVEAIYNLGGATNPIRPGDSLHLLVGKIDAAGAENLADGGNIWVSVNHQAGTVTAVENLAGGSVAACRALAVQRQVMGAR